jgi:ABC-type polysaccharide/polyol phosphate transport system ATPase subunit
MSNHMTEHSIEFENVSKRYRLGTLGTLRGTVSALFSKDDSANNWRRTLWALRDVSFLVEPGGSLGLIGPNGAGKTTILKLLSSITRPTSGRIAVQGRISSLIELGAGFHPELTGRDNIYLNGAILGLTRREITRKLDDIIAFSELERFIDTPVKRYSSGMYVRLGFAVAAHVQPDVLLVDEVLAVGDASFRERCLNHMRKLRQSGTTVVFVSHNMYLVETMCERVLLLANGQVRAEGKASAVIAEYERLMQSGGLRQESEQTTGESSGFDAEAGLTLTRAEIVPATESSTEGLISHLPAVVRIYYNAPTPIRIGRISIFMMRKDKKGILCSTGDSSKADGDHQQLHELSGSGVIEVTYDPLQLTSGYHFFEVAVTDASDAKVLAWLESPSFYVYAPSETVSPDKGIFVPQLSWTKRGLEG